MAEVRCLVLGQVAVQRGSGAAPVAGNAARLLAALVAAHPRPQPVDALIDAIWAGRPTATADTGLRVLASQLRGLLRDGDDDPVEFTPGGYRLTLSDEELDAARFEQLLATASAHADGGRAQQATTTIDAALALWRGPAFGAFADGDLVRPEAVRLELLLLDAQDLQVEALLLAGRAADAARLGELRADAEPLRELRWVQLMLALYRSGRQAEALRAYRTARATLTDELGLEPGPQLRAMEQAVLLQDPQLDAGPTDVAARPVEVGSFVGALRSTTASALPVAPTVLVGRTGELDAVAELVARHRLVTIIGPGGAGKTRLALGLAERDEGRAAVFVALATVGPDEVMAAVADQLGVQPRSGEELLDTLVAHLRSIEALVVLDNCEHVLDETARLATCVLEWCPGVVVLATSRAALGVPGEVRFALGPMDASDARRLFLERVHAVGTSIGATPARVDLVLERLDRLPLAIELAAGQLDVMSWAELEKAVDAGRGALREPRRAEARHRDLLTTVGWSFELLDETTAEVFVGLAPLRGWFVAEDAAAVLDAPLDETVARLRTLSRSSMVVADPHVDATRFQLLETMRWFATDRLGPRIVAFELRHRRHYARVLADATSRMRGVDEAAAVTRLELAIDDVRAAFRRAVELGDLDVAAELAIGVWQFAVVHLRWDLLDWAEVAGALPGADRHPARARLLGVSATTAWIRSEPERSKHLADAAVSAAQSRGDDVPIEARHALLDVAGFEGRVDDAIGHLRAIAEWSVERGEPYWLTNTHVLTTIGAVLNGLEGLSAAAAKAAVDVAERSGNPTSIGWASYAVGFDALAHDADVAIAAFERGVAHARSVRSGWVIGMNLSGLATALRRAGRHGEAMLVLREVIGLWERSHHRAQLRHALVEVAFNRWAEGDLDDAGLALRLADEIPLGFPVLPADRRPLEELRAALAVRPGSARGEGLDDLLQRIG